MEAFHQIALQINSFLWHDWVLYTVLATCVLYTVWSVSSQYRALTHGAAVTLGYYDNQNDPGAINHFQALSTALSGTVGLGNIGGVAIAISLGGPGALFWMWVVGVLGVSMKMVEVTLAMLYRNLDDPQNPHGGPMWVAKKAFAEKGAGWAKFGTWLGGLYCVTLLIGAFTGANMFQAWNVAEVSASFFGIPRLLVGAVLAMSVAAVLIGGIKRVGQVTGIFVPVMCVIYVTAGIIVIALNISQVPAMFKLIISSAFSPTESTGAFVGGSVGAAMLWGMKRALFSSEIGQGSSAIAHSAAKTAEPVREGIIAGLEPIIDTIIVCTITGLVILLSGVWNRSPDLNFDSLPAVVQQSDSSWIVHSQRLLENNDLSRWTEGSGVFMVRTVAGKDDKTSGYRRWYGSITRDDKGIYLSLDPVISDTRPVLRDAGVFKIYAGASLTAFAFDQTYDGLGRWLIVIAAWMFALSTIIAWGYYGEQAFVYLFGSRRVIAFKLLYCTMTLVATFGFIRTDRELDTLTTIGTGIVLIASMSITLTFGHKAIAAYRQYIPRLKAGEFLSQKHDLGI